MGFWNSSHFVELAVFFLYIILQFSYYSINRNYDSVCRYSFPIGSLLSLLKFRSFFIPHEITITIPGTNGNSITDAVIYVGHMTMIFEGDLRALTGRFSVFHIKDKKKKKLLVIYIIIDIWAVFLRAI